MTYTPVQVWDMRISFDKSVSFAVPDGHTKLLVVLRGAVTIHGAGEIKEAEVVSFEREGDTIQIENAREAMVLMLCGEPLGEPIVGYGPFVMNTSLEIHEAINDYRNGRLGHLS
jgi:hypothetical protein